MQVSVLNKLIFNVQILGHRFCRTCYTTPVCIQIVSSMSPITDMSHWRDIMNSIQMFLMQAHVHVLTSLSIIKEEKLMRDIN